MLLLKRLWKAVSSAHKIVHAKVLPVSYAKKIGVNVLGSLNIYGSSYSMFSTEPYLVTIGDNVHITPGVLFLCHDGAILPQRKHEPTLDVTASIVIGENSFIGTRAVIMPGVKIGANCIVGACAVVSKDVPRDSVVAGNPAVVVKTTDQYIEGARKKSTQLGNLYGDEKVIAYKKLFEIE